jgi:hypothetical protein
MIYGKNEKLRSLKSLLVATAFLLTSQLPVSAATNVAVLPAAKFVDSLGVNTHVNIWADSAYGNIPMIESELKYIGFKYARDDFGDISTIQTVQRVNHDIGTKFDIIVRGDMAPQISYLKANAGLLAEVEGPNEVDGRQVTFNGQTGFSAAAAFQRQLFSSIKTTSGISGLPVNCLSVADKDVIRFIGNLASSCDNLSIHVYPQWGGGAHPISEGIQWYLTNYAGLALGKAAVATEFGWWTQPMSGGVAQDVQAKYILNYFFDAYTMGIRRSYIYELNDEYLDPRNTDTEWHFGLFTADGKPKAAATALQNLTTLLKDPKPFASPAGLPLTVTANASVKKLLMQRGDGVYVLALWQDLPSWNYSTGQRVTVPPQKATISLGLTAAKVQVIDPMITNKAATTLYNMRTLTQTVPDHPILIFFHR